MKKIVSSLLLVIILLTSTLSFASMEDKLSKHWAKDLVDKEFLSYYFPYFAKDSFSKFEPNKEMSKKDFALSLASLFKDYDIEPTNSIVVDTILTRREAVELIGEKLVELENIIDKKEEIPFKDINTMDEESIELLVVLFNLKIIYGVSNTEFMPDGNLTQIESIIILQRLKGVLEEMRGIREVSFNVSGIVESYNNQESVIVKEDKDKVLVTITKEFPTPGYSLGVEKVVNGGGNYKIYLDIKPPKEGMMQMQVITYKTMTIEIPKEESMKPPYIFNVIGLESNLFRI